MFKSGLIIAVATIAVAIACGEERVYTQAERYALEHCSEIIMALEARDLIKDNLNDPDSFEWLNGGNGGGDFTWTRQPNDAGYNTWHAYFRARNGSGA